jgi:hypothetical protein
MGRSKRNDATGKGGGGSKYLALPHALLHHPNYLSMHVYSRQLLTEIGASYTGFNNGDLACTYKLMCKRGWKSNATLLKYLKPLLDRGFLVRTKVGGLRMGPHLYALTWKPIDRCKGKLDMQPTEVALNWWRTGVPK